MQTVTAMGVFCLLYQLLLRKLTFFSLNRWYLLVTLLISISFPFIKMQVLMVQENTSSVAIQTKVAAQQEAENFTEEISDAGNVILKDMPGSEYWNIFSKSTYLIYTYLLISFLFLTRILIVIVALSYKYIHAEKDGNFRIVRSFWKFSNCSFFNLLIIDSNRLNSEEMDQIIAHEQQHAIRFHSVDKMLIELLRVLMWFNPFLYYYRTVIDEVHEYEVDLSMGNKFDKKVYSNLLLKLSLTSSPYLINSFSNNPLKKRIQMLFTNHSSNMKKLNYVFAAPIIVLMFWFFSCEIAYATKIKAKARKTAITDNVLRHASSTSVTFLKNEYPSIERVNDDLKHGILKVADLPKIAMQNITSTIAGEVLINSHLKDEKVDPRKFRVVLDPGHGGKDSLKKVGNVYEKDLALEISKEIKRVLEEKGYEVVLTRNDDVWVPLTQRADIKGDVFISIHVNNSVGVGMEKDKYNSLNGIDIYTSRYEKPDSTVLASRDRLADAFKNSLSQMGGLKFN